VGEDQWVFWLSHSHVHERYSERSHIPLVQGGVCVVTHDRGPWGSQVRIHICIHPCFFSFLKQKFSSFSEFDMNAMRHERLNSGLGASRDPQFRFMSLM